MLTWNSNQYLEFKKERTLPATDLANHIAVKNPQHILDIGCGPGNSTFVLAEKFPRADILGIDSSEEMIKSAHTYYPELSFMLCDASADLSILPHSYDVIFSNACLQWIPDHKSLLPRLMTRLNGGGVLAVQVPINYNEPIHQVIAQVSSSPKWKSKFSNPRIFYTLRPNEYYNILSEIASDFNLWCTTYCHRMQSHEQLLEWYRGTGLRPYLSVLNEEDKAEFEKDIYESIIKVYPIQKNGEIIFNFPRLFFTATK